MSTPSAASIQCEELDRLRREVAAALLEAKRIRRTRDLSMAEDEELSRRGHRKINALIKHLLSGHGGKPCPAGERHIVNAREMASSSASRS